jgi:hypothetical protein
MTTVLIGQRLYDWDGPGMAGVVTDTHFIRCFWPRLTEPTKIFAEGSSGLVVQGPPTPRNVVFPEDTLFPKVVCDADSAAVGAAMAASGGKSGLVNATPEMVQAYLAAYEAEAAKAEPHTTEIACRDDCQFLVHKELDEVYVAELTKQEAIDYCDGKVSRESLDTVKLYCSINDNPKDAATKVYLLEEGGLVETAKVQEVK